MIQKFLELKPYKLWLDGTIEANPDEVQDLLLSGISESQISVPFMTREIEQYNRLSSSKIKIKDDLDFTKFNFEYKIPAEYKKINLEEFFKSKYSSFDPNKTISEEGWDRINAELNEIEKRNLHDFFRTLIYIVDVLKEHNVVYGVGRGSSCACYLLYLLGLHKVDCLKYEIPMEEFFKN